MEQYKAIQETKILMRVVTLFTTLFMLFFTAFIAPSINKRMELQDLDHVQTSQSKNDIEELKNIADKHSTAIELNKEEINAIKGERNFNIAKTPGLTIKKSPKVNTESSCLIYP